MLVGLLIALAARAPGAQPRPPYLTFGRLRPLHTNAVIFAFAGNAIFAGDLLLDAAPAQGAHVLATRSPSSTSGAGRRSSSPPRSRCRSASRRRKEYAELEWPIDIAIAVVWVVFAVNFFGTLARRREQHLYVAIWFYIATIVTIAVLHIFNNLAIPAGLFKSYSIYAGVQDAFMQWWYGHNAVAFFLTTPFLGLMYYFLPKAAERPVFSLPALDPPLLVAGLHLHLGRPAPPALHRAARVGVDARHALLA